MKRHKHKPAVCPRMCPAGAGAQVPAEAEREQSAGHGADEVDRCVREFGGIDIVLWKEFAA